MLPDTSRNNKKTENDVPLSKRELEIVKLIGEGKTSQEISELLFIGKTTVDTHRKNMLAKLQLKNTATLVKYAADHHLL